MKGKSMKLLDFVLFRSMVLVLVLLCAGMLALGCHTLHGFGEDTERAGEGIQRSAE